MGGASAVDLGGNVYTVLPISNSLLVIKTTSDSTVVYTFTVAESDQTTVLSDPKMVVDTSGNIYVVATRLRGTTYDVLITKINDTGTAQLWTQYITTGVSSVIQHPDIAINRERNLGIIYQVSNASTAGYDLYFCILNYTSGNIISNNTITAINTPGNDTYPSLSTDGSGSLYAVYVSDLSDNSQVVTTVLLDSTYTTPVWMRNSAPPPQTVPCFLEGTLVHTRFGYRCIESLAIGDKIFTADGRLMPITHISKTLTIPSEHTNPYIIPKGLYGATQRLLISPRHCISVPERGMVEAQYLGLRQWKMREPFVYYNLRLEEYVNIVIHGVEVESLAHIETTIMTVKDFLAFLHKKGRSIKEKKIQQYIKEHCQFVGTDKIKIKLIKK